MNEDSPNLDYLATTRAEFPCPDAEWLRQLVELRRNECFRFYIARLQDIDTKTVELMLQGFTDNNALRELLGEIRGLRRLTFELDTDEKKLQLKLKQNEQATKES